MDYEYVRVNTDNKIYNRNKTNHQASIYLVRQIWINSGVWMIYFMLGLNLGAPAVFIPQMRKEANSSDVVSMEMASWLSSATGYASIPWLLVLAPLSDFFGRVLTQIIVCNTALGAFILFYFSTDPRQILLCDVMLGCLTASSMSTTLMISTECSSPKYRGIFLTMKTASMYWGIWISNAIGTFFHYKYIPLLGILCAIYNLIVCFWSESPYWLARNGRLDEGKEKLFWLKGYEEASTNDLEYLLNLQELSKHKSDKKNSYWKEMVKTVKLKEFYIPALLGLCITSQYYFSGKVACSVYTLQIIKEITGNESAAYNGMLLLDGVCVFSMYVGSALSRYIKRRTLYFISAWLGILFLFLLSAYLCLVNFQLIKEDSFVTIGILAVYSISISIGVTVLCTSLFAEVMPIKFKSIAMCVSGIGTGFILATIIKMTPSIFKSFGSHGAFLFYGCTAKFFTLILLKYLPETKDKTLQEIENIFKKEEPSVTSA